MQVERLPNFYRMIANLTGLDYYSKESARGRRRNLYRGRYCPHCEGTESFFHIVETYENGRLFRSSVLHPLDFLKTAGTIVLGRPTAQTLMEMTALDACYDCGYPDCVTCDLDSGSLPENFQMVQSTCWLYLEQPDTHSFLCVPEPSSDWKDIARRWIHERIPQITLYRLDTQAETVPNDDHVLETFPIAATLELPSMTRMELLMDPNRVTGDTRLSEWYETDHRLVLRIGDRLVLMRRRERENRQRLNRLHLLVADQLAVASTMCGYTGLTVAELGVLASSLWACSGLLLAPRISASVLANTSAILVSYLLFTEENQELLVRMINTALGGKSPITYEDFIRHGITIKNWSVRQEKLIEIINLIRSQVGLSLL